MIYGKILKKKEKKEDIISSMMSENKQYLEYIKEHKENVTKAFQVYGTLIIDLLYDDNINKQLTWERLYEKIRDGHDDSKYENEEFESYRRKFFPRDGEKPISDYEFNKAWLHHIHNNPHHPEYWIYQDYEELKSKGKAQIFYYPMDDDAIIEMLCDWIAMSYKFNNKVYDWYKESNKGDILNEDTRFIVEEILKAIKRYDEEELKNN